MKEQKETTFKENIEKATQYVKKLFKKALYHSDTVYFKLKLKYNEEVALKVITILKKKGFFNDSKYMNLIKNSAKLKYFGIERFNKILFDKQIKINYDFYTFEEEYIVLQSYIHHIRDKINQLPEKQRYKKFYYHLKYQGFSKYNVARINFIDIINI